MEKKKCLICGKMTAQHKIKPVTYQYKMKKFTINQPAYWCEACGEGVIMPEDNQSVENDIQKEQNKIDNGYH